MLLGYNEINHLIIILTTLRYAWTQTNEWGLPHEIFNFLNVR